MHLVYIHGAMANGKCLHFLRSQFDQNSSTVIEYDYTRNFSDNLDDMLATLANKSDLFFIAHSLGGIYALHLADRLKTQTRGGITMSTPYGGSQTAVYLQRLPLFNLTQLIKDLGPASKIMLNSQAIRLTVPWANLITTAGHFFIIGEPNDGVITTTSMRYRNDIQHIEIDQNHYDVLYSMTTVKYIAMHIIACANINIEKLENAS